MKRPRYTSHRSKIGIGRIELKNRGWFKKPEVFYHKTSEGVTSPLVFNPAEYDGTPKEQKERAYDDAKNHLRFYQLLIKEKVYPEKTKVHIRKLKHSNNYVIDIFMPEVRMNNRENEASEMMIERLRERIIHLSEKNNVLYTEKRNFLPEHAYLDYDINTSTNYGFDNEGNPHYVDREVFKKKLPYKHRRNVQESRLESKILTIIGGAFFFLSALTSSIKLTGNVVLNEPNVISTNASLIFILLGIVILIYNRIKISKRN